MNMDEVATMDVELDNCEEIEKLIKENPTSAYNKIKSIIEDGEPYIILAATKSFLNKYKDLVFLAVNCGYNIKNKIIINPLDRSLPSLDTLLNNNQTNDQTVDTDDIKEIVATNYELMKKIIKEQDANIINYTTDEFLKEHEDLLELALKNNYKYSIKSNITICKYIASNYEFAKKIIEEDYANIIDYSTNEFLIKHNDLIELAFKNNYRYHSSASEIIKIEISKNYELTKKIIEEDANIIDSFSQKFLSEHKDIIELALKNNYDYFYSSKPNIIVCKYIASNYELTKKIIEERNPEIIGYSTNEFLQEHEDLIELAVNNGYMCYDSDNNYINEKIATNYELMIKMIKEQDANIINYATEEFLSKHEDLIDLAFNNGYKINYYSPNIIKDNVKYIKMAINNGQENSVSFATDKVFLENHDLIIYAFDKGYWDRITNIEYETLDVTEILDDKQIKVLFLYYNIDDSCVADEFRKYIINNYETINEEKIEVMGDLYYRLSTTNSKILYSMRESLANQIQYLNNPLEDFNKIEKIFLKNNIPLYAKMFLCFKILYPNLINGKNNMDFSDESRMSPQLKDMSLPKIDMKHFINNPTNNDIRFHIIYNDLVRNAVKSNSMDLRKYLDNIELGDYLYKKILGEKISNDKFDIMSDEEKKEALEIFAAHLETIYNNTLEGKDNNIDISNSDLPKKIKILKDKFKTTNIYDLKDRIVRMFCYSAGYTSFEQIRNEMNNSIKEANDRGIKYANELKSKKFEFEDGDFLRCIGDYNAFASSIENGNFSKEFLTVFKGYNDSDTTPLDIDFSLIENNKNIYKSIENTPTGFGFGNVYLIIKKDNPNVYVTRDENGNLTGKQYNPKKVEMFGTLTQSGGYYTHWGARTGMSLTDVDYILYKEDRKIDSENPYNEDGSINYVSETNTYDDLSKIKFEIARHGYYIPIIDFTGQLIFSVEEYNFLREKMNGLSYYGINEYKFSDNLEILSGEYMDSFFETSNNVVKSKKKKLYPILESVLNELNLKTKYKSDNSLIPGYVEILDTGSTGRGTNDFYSGDFDLLFRIDQQLYRDTNKYNELRNSIMNKLKAYPYEYCGVTDNGDLRLKKVQIDQDTIIDIDISFVIKKDQLIYSTNECIKDRLETIKKQDKEKYIKVITNIILAKKILKESECYKPSRSDSNQGGLGGSGIENWILQNGGSLYDAINDFLSVANNCNSFEEFKKQYSIWDFGENFFADRKGNYPYDNYVYNMNEIGFNKMKSCLNDFIFSFNNNKNEESAKSL